jgi:para-aminobenzoate synthetase component I
VTLAIPLVPARNPAPFGAYLEFGGAHIASISPERFIRFDATTRTAEARPIKGTRPRATAPAKDAALARELSASEKDRAENIMIVDLLRAAFPGGSVTGAPKIRAMQIIAERAPRGVYCGAIGYVSATGAMDFNIPIRTMVLHQGGTTFHAGAGIVWDSVPVAEYDETLAKARTMIEALTSPRRTPRTHGRAHPPA